MYELIKAPDTLGMALKNQRRRQGLSLEDVSNLTLMGKRFISEIENGKASASFKKLLEYVQSLGLAISIFSRNQNKEKPYGQIKTVGDLGKLCRYQRKRQKLTLSDMVNMSSLGLRFLSDFENGRDARLFNVLSALENYGLDLFIHPKDKDNS